VIDCWLGIVVGMCILAGIVIGRTWDAPKCTKPPTVAEIRPIALDRAPDKAERPAPHAHSR
jgi:hypothetical protein